MMSGKEIDIYDGFEKYYLWFFFTKYKINQNCQVGMMNNAETQIYSISLFTKG